MHIDTELRNQNHISLIVSLFLSNLGYYLNKEGLNKYLNTHPYSGSLLSISDYLTTQNIDCAALEASYDDLMNFGSQILVHTLRSKFLIVKKMEPNGVEVLDDHNNSTFISKLDFLSIWDGRVLLAQNNIKGSFYRKIFTSLSNISVSYLAIFLFVISILWFSYQNKFIFTAIYLPFIFIKLIGTIITLLLLQKTIHTNNTFTDRLCSLTTSKNNAESGCDSLINSQYGQVFNWLNWSEIGYIYFCSSLFFLITANLTPNNLSLISLMAIINMPFTVYSLTFQIKNKVYCALCIVVIILIFIEGSYSFQTIQLDKIDLNSIFKYIYVCITISASWFIFKSNYNNKNLNTSLQAKLTKFKYDKTVFNMLHDTEFEIEELEEAPMITLGNLDSTLNLTLVLNPYCSPCKESHAIMEKILDQYHHLFKLKIVLPVSNHPTDIRTEKVKYFYNVYLSYGGKVLRDELSKWFGLKDNSTFVEIVTPFKNNNDLEIYLDYAQNFIHQTQISYTPAIFINNKLLPKHYTFDDLGSLILLLSA